MIDHVPNQDEDLRLFKIFRKVVDANLALKIKWEERLVRGEGLATKFFDHVTAIVFLLRGTRIAEVGIEFVDAATINIAARAAFECMLAFAYILVLPVDADEADLRFCLWMLADLNNRQTYPSTSDESKKILSDDKTKIDLLMAKLAANPRFIAMSDKSKNFFLKKRHWRIKEENGKWGVRGWVDIGIDVELSESFVRPFYNYLSSYAHTGFLSVLQLQTAIVERRQSPPLDGLIDMVRVMTANMIDLYCQVFSQSRNALYEIHEDVVFIQNYLDVGTKLMKGKSDETL